jgi:hypothetical protein
MDFISEPFRYLEKVDKLFICTIIEFVAVVFAQRALNTCALRFSPGQYQVNGPSSHCGASPAIFETTDTEAL